MQNILLTDEQRGFVAERHGLIFSFLHKHNLPSDEWYGVAAIGFCKAASKYDPERKTAFSTYAYQVMLNEIRMEMRKEGTRKKNGISFVSLQSELEDGLTIEDTLGCDSDYFTEDDYTRTEAEIFIQTLNPIQQTIIRGLDEGLRQREIAKTLNISQPYVSRLIKKMKTKFKKNYL